MTKSLIANLLTPFSSTFVTRFNNSFGLIVIKSTSILGSLLPPITNFLSPAAPALILCAPPTVADVILPDCAASIPLYAAFTIPSVLVVILPAPSIMPPFSNHCSAASLTPSLTVPATYLVPVLIGKVTALTSAFFINFGLINPPYNTMFCTVSIAPPVTATL